MSLRTRLLLLSLLTLVLPWAGCQYARQMEVALKQGQEEALLTTAESLARVVGTESELLYGDSTLTDDFDPKHGDLFATDLSSPPLLDGFADEWPVPARALPDGADAEGMARVALYRQALYIFLSVDAPQVHYENPSAANLNAADRIVVLTDTEDGTEQAWCISAIAPGPVVPRKCIVGAPWSARSTQEQEIAGIWRATSKGYDVELRFPLRFIGKHLAVFSINAEGLPSHPVPTGRLHTASEVLRHKLEIYAPEGLRISVVDAHGWLLARAGQVFSNKSNADIPFSIDERSNLQSFYRSLLGRTEEPSLAYGLPYGMWGRPIDAARLGKEDAAWFEAANGEPSTIRAAVPILVNGKSVGALAVEQAGDRLLTRRDAALTRLLNFTFIATFIAIAGALAFAAWLLRRIRRLSKATATALTPEGRIEAHIPDTGAQHELGDLARSFATLLTRLKEYTDYLQTLGAKLSHEFRTPLTIVSSSLENLSLEQLPPAAALYVGRARQGSTRLHAILTAMTEATRVEQSIEQAERVEFDLGTLVRSAGLAYQQTFASHRIETTTDDATAPFIGAPELIAQLLDKLMDNAADFCPRGGLIRIELNSDPKQFLLSVTNEGSVLEPLVEHTLFSSLVSNRKHPGERPHLGLGLYIVRLIAEFHQGAAYAENLESGAGVRFTIRLPRQASDTRHNRDM